MPKPLYSSLTLICLALLVLLWFQLPAALPQSETKPLPTYFTYSAAERDALKQLSSSFVMDDDSLKKWDKFIYTSTEHHHVSAVERLRLTTYLYVAMRDAAFLSFNAKGAFEGTFDPVCYGVLLLFFPTYPLPIEYRTDPFSEKLAVLILPKLQERFQRENALHLTFTSKEEGDYKITKASTGLDVANWIPWLVTPVNIYLPAAPPAPNNDAFWDKQLLEIKKGLKSLTQSQIEAVYYWSGMAGRGSGDWGAIASKYLFDAHLPFAKVVLVRSVLLMTLYDATIGYYNAKYTFLVARPQDKDPSVTPLVDIPPDPSYPAAHATLGGAAATVLSYYFPEKKQEWNQLAREASSSRLWAGLDYPISIQAGQTLGVEIATRALLAEQAQEEHP